MALVPYALARPVLFGMDPEAAHELTLHRMAKLQNTPAQILWSQPRVADPVTVAGLKFPNRVGLAAGLDKNGRCIDGLGAMGFGFIEVGTVTPKPQPGNPKPRIFRLPQQNALINRLGFNNEGLDAFLANVRRATSFRQAGGVLGLNIGKNAATPIENAVDDSPSQLHHEYGPCTPGCTRRTTSTSRRGPISPSSQARSSGKNPSVRCCRRQLTTSSGPCAMLKSPISRNSRPRARAARRDAVTPTTSNQTTHTRRTN